MLRMSFWRFWMKRAKNSRNIADLDDSQRNRPISCNQKQPTLVSYEHKEARR